MFKISTSMCSTIDKIFHNHFISTDLFAAFRNQSALLTMAKSKQSSLQTTVLNNNLRIAQTRRFGVRF